MSALEIRTYGFIPISVETGKEIKLAMQRLWLVGRILPVGARLLVRHTFRSEEKKPLEVIYAFGLPRDAALRRFRITGEGFAVSSDLRTIEKAAEAYEKGIEDGHLAALARQYQDGVVNLSVGNIRPGEEVSVLLEVLAGVEAHDDGLRFRFPFTLAPSYHSRARMAEVRPGFGEIELSGDEFGDVILPQFASDASSLHEVGFDLAVAMPGEIKEVSSPSHPVRTVSRSAGRSRLSLATARDVPDRDLVIDVRTADSKGAVLAGTDSQGKGRFAALIPSPSFGEVTEEPRRIVFVLDRSGSMNGAPIVQARKALEACLAALSAEDRFGIVAFNDTAEVFKGDLVAADMKNREKAAAFLEKILARSGTELAAAIQAAAKIFTGEAGDIMLLTDGQVFGIDPIIETARSTGLRIHCLGIGSAGQDFFLSQLARETGAVSRSVTPRERVDMMAVELFASIGRPLASDIGAKVDGFEDGSVSPEPPKHIFAGTPLLLFGETSGQGEGRLRIEWAEHGKRRELDLPLAVRPGGEGETIRLLQGARLITSLEAQMGAQEGPGRRAEKRGLKMLENLSQTYGLASRAMSLVAVVERKGDRPGDLPVTRVVPVGMPQDVGFGAYFAMPTSIMSLPSVGAVLTKSLVLNDSAEIHEEIPAKLRRGMIGKLFARPVRGDLDVLKKTTELDEESARRQGSGERVDLQSALVALAARIEPDGGMAGKTEEERVLASVLAILQFLAGGHSTRSGAFRKHVERLVKFLELAKVQNDVIREVVKRAREGNPVPGNWSGKKPDPSLWTDLEQAL
jgi:Ca-activated chloride channel family protein